MARQPGGSSLLLPMLAALCFTLTYTASATADEGTANANVETAGSRARFAHDFCSVSPQRIEQYKTRVKGVQKDATDFERHWQTGWERVDDDATQMNELRQRDPQEYAARVKSDCERLKWVAQNALRPKHTN